MRLKEPCKRRSWRILIRERGGGLLLAVPVGGGGGPGRGAGAGAGAPDAAPPPEEAYLLRIEEKVI